MQEIQVLLFWNCMVHPFHLKRLSRLVFVLNLMLLDSISPALNGRFFAHMKNEEKLMISRQYASHVKNVVMGGNKNEA